MSPETEPCAVTGGCLCGGVRYRARVTGSVTECHCKQCQRQSGYRYATTVTVGGEITIEDDGGLTWYRASPEAERGFCATCGSTLFWREVGDPDPAILVGTVDDPSGLRVVRHIFVESKSPLLDLNDGLPRFIGSKSPDD